MKASILMISQEYKNIVVSILKKLEIEKEEKDNSIILITFDYLYSITNTKERGLIKKILEIKPKEYGIKLPFLGIGKIPENLVAIKNQKYIWQKEKKEIATQYLPKPAYNALQIMNGALHKDLHHKLLVKSGYRSPAYQVLTFLYWLSKFEYNLEETLKQVAIPGYSEHELPKKQAVDFITQDGVIWGDQISFDDTREYGWLQKNADTFNFYLSYPKNNKLGVMFEPWHWHFKP